MRDNNDVVRDFVRYEIMTDGFVLPDAPDRERILKIVVSLVDPDAPLSGSGNITSTFTTPWCIGAAGEAATFLEKTYSEASRLNIKLGEIIFYRRTKFGLFVNGPFEKELGRFTAEYLKG